MSLQHGNLQKGTELERTGTNHDVMFSLWENYSLTYRVIKWLSHWKYIWQLKHFQAISSRYVITVTEKIKICDV